MKKDELIELFNEPGCEYRGKPFWSWNGELEADELKRQVKVMKEMGLGGYFMHSRAGLITEYLGDEWFDLINKTADAGEELGMEAWLYDEDRWPSGSAGGKVTVDPQYRMKALCVFQSTPDKYTQTDDTLIVFAARIDGLTLSDYYRIQPDADMTAIPDGYSILNFRIIPDKPSSNYNGTTYIDTMSYKAVNRFIELTHEKYKEKCGDRLGRSIKGIFTDEPHRGHMMDNRREQDGVISCSVAYTDDIFEQFNIRYGYDAEAILPELFYQKNGNPVSRVKLNYVDLCNNLFLERFMKTINDWCNNNGIIFTGHVLHEDSLANQTVPNGSLMRTYEYMGYPGIDLLTEFNRCYWVVKQLSSSARQLGKKWLLSELYGCTGWQFNLRSHKAVGDWQALFGINLRCQHLSWYTMEGESKRDYPASILHQSPWYHDYSFVENYFARFGVLMSEGKPCCDVLVLNPIESIWCRVYLGWAAWISSASSLANEIEHKYTELFTYLTRAHIDFDYGEEQMMIPRTTIEMTDKGAVLHVGEASYTTVVVGGMLTMRPSTLEILKKFAAAGGKVIFAGDVPSYVDAVESSAVSELANNCICVPFEQNAITSAVKKCSTVATSVTANGAAEGDVLMQLRYSEDSDSYIAVLLNTNREQPKENLTFSLKLSEGYVPECWNMENGEHSSVEYSCSDGVMSIPVSLFAAGTAAFVISKDKISASPKPCACVKASFDIGGMYDYTLDEPNVCVLDFAKWRWEGKEFSQEAESLKVDQQIRDSIGIERRGGEMLQPWFAKLHDKKVYGELELQYDFFIDIMPEGDVFLCGERPEYNDYSINGTTLSCPDKNDFYIDNCLKKMPVPLSALHRGRNTITVKTSFMRTTNVESLYLIGNFGVMINGHTRTIVALPEKAGFDNLINYNMPFYTGCITYKMNADMLGVKAYGDTRVFIKADNYVGGLVKVCCDGKESILAWEPYEADITEAVKNGSDIFVTLVGTRRNLFGPLHLVPAIHGAYGPGHFVTGGGAWTDNYNLIDAKLGILTFEIK